MGDTFRRVSLNQRRKKSTVSNELRVRKKSMLAAVDTSKWDIEGKENVNQQNLRKISRPNLRIGEDVNYESRKSSMQDYEREVSIDQEDQLSAPKEANLVDGKGVGKKEEKIAKYFTWAKSILEKNENLIQVLIVLPLLLTALYILFVEKGQLMFWSNAR